MRVLAAEIINQPLVLRKMAATLNIDLPRPDGEVQLPLFFIFRRSGSFLMDIFACRKMNRNIGPTASHSRLGDMAKRQLSAITERACIRIER